MKMVRWTDGARLQSRPASVETSREWAALWKTIFFYMRSAFHMNCGWYTFLEMMPFKMAWHAMNMLRGRAGGGGGGIGRSKSKNKSICNIHLINCEQLISNYITYNALVLSQNCTDDTFQNVFLWSGRLQVCHQPVCFRYVICTNMERLETINHQHQQCQCRAHYK